MDDKTWAAYQAMSQESQDQSVADLTAESMRQMRWLSNAKSRIFKEMQKQNAEIRKEVRAQVAKEIEQKPIYRALRLIKFGRQRGMACVQGLRQTVSDIIGQRGPRQEHLTWFR
jgi:hypothetical protein